MSIRLLIILATAAVTLPDLNRSQYRGNSMAKRLAVRPTDSRPTVVGPRRPLHRRSVLGADLIAPSGLPTSPATGLPVIGASV